MRAPAEPAGSFSIGAVPVDAGAELGHGDGLGAVIAHPQAVILRRDLKIEGGDMGPPLLLGPDGEPQVVLVGAAAVEPPCIPVDAGDMKVQLLLGIGGGHGGMDLAAQLLEGSDDQIQILLLVGLEPLQPHY